MHMVPETSAREMGPVVGGESQPRGGAARGAGSRASAARGAEGKGGGGVPRLSHLWEWGVPNVKLYSVLFGIETTISKNKR